MSPASASALHPTLTVNTHRFRAAEPYFLALPSASAAPSAAPPSSPADGKARVQIHLNWLFHPLPSSHQQLHQPPAANEGDAVSAVLVDVCFIICVDCDLQIIDCCAVELFLDLCQPNACIY
jgi:hypothetical protein